ncbi:hypothetical protein A9Q88_04210 [Gammaproteobacteria bacterium 50_400_T64]|nr:hypothetical protein A9Q88_04210 [Gammaproteobacteria bacterium 50_400_T64]
MQNISALAIYKSIFRTLNAGSWAWGEQDFAIGRHRQQRRLTKGNWRLSFASLECAPELSL